MFPPIAPTFSQQQGPWVNMPNTASPFQFFLLFFDDALITMLVNGTNEYAWVVIGRKTGLASKPQAVDGGNGDL